MHSLTCLGKWKQEKTKKKPENKQTNMSKTSKKNRANNAPILSECLSLCRLFAHIYKSHTICIAARNTAE